VTRPLYQVDAFTAEPFAGNPAAVCLLDGDADPAWMQRVAAEMNLSETAFLRPGGEAGRYGLRWFTPAVEVELCGHATLASAHVLFTEGLAEAGQELRFDAASGPLAARRDPDPDVRRLEALGVRGVIVTAAGDGDGGHDFVSRFFAPGAGIDEDPVTGSAHCTLGPFWAERLGRAELTGFQASARGGLVQVRPRGDRVLLGGRAVTVLRGQLL
jgi:predicted PhzF superfamily epimerase YddE/YHI9